MPRVPKAKLDLLLNQASNDSSAHVRGAALEEAVSVVLRAIPGVGRPIRDQLDYAHASEIDLLFPNKKSKYGLWFFEEAFLCECKNWNTRAGSAEVGNFKENMRMRACRFGLLISSNGITGDPVGLTAANNRIADALSNGFHIIVLTLPEIREITTGLAAAKLIEEKWLRLKAFRTSF